MSIFALSHFYPLYRYYFVLGSPYLTLSLTFSLFGATSYHSSLYVCDIIPLLPPLLLSNQSVFFARSLPPSLFIFLTDSKSLSLSSCRSLFFSLTLSLYANTFHSYSLSFPLSLTFSSLRSLSLSLLSTNTISHYPSIILNSGKKLYWIFFFLMNLIKIIKWQKIILSLVAYEKQIGRAHV